MTLNEFIKTIHKAGKINDSLKQIACDLCKASGINMSDNTITAWLKDKSANSGRTPQYNGGKINEAGFIQYFKNHTRSTWKEVQKEFSGIDQHGFINCDTEDEEVFYGSLLDLFYDIFRLVPVTLCSVLPKKPLLFGRENEMEQIEEILMQGKSRNSETGNYALLTGVGGIGKSNLALAYAHSLMEKGGWIIQHVTCEDSESLRESVNKLQFDNAIEAKGAGKDADKDKFDCIVDALKNRKKPVLIILDNLNQPFSVADRKDFEKLSKCGNHVLLLITSRNKPIHEKGNMIHVHSLEKDALLELYAYHRFEDSSHHESYINEHGDVLEKIFTLVGNHTLMITLLAKLPERTALNEYELYRRMSVGLDLPTETVYMTKDGACIEDTAKNIIKNLFKIAQLTDSEKAIMKYMSIMPFGGIRCKLFEELTGCPAKDIRSLIKGHWIMEDEETLELRLHPLICDAILGFDETKLTPKMCIEFRKRMSTKMDSSPEDKYQAYIFSKISLCIATRIYFPALRDFRFSNNPQITFFDVLKDEYKEAWLVLNEFGIKISNSSNISANSAELSRLVTLGEFVARNSDNELEEDEE